ncbi:MAG: CD1247 N-terminal domain-containing protein [Acutalibacteraceae bacterium]
MNISEKAAYLKGLISGMEYDVNSREGKLFAGIIDLLEDISPSVLDSEDETATLGEYVEELDHDLGALEEECYDCDCCEDDDCDCDCCGGDFEELEAACGETIYLDPTPSPTTI